MEMNGARDQILADAAFAREQHGGARRRDAHTVAKICCMPALRPTMLSHWYFRPSSSLSWRFSSRRVADFQRFVDDRGQVIERERLEQKIGGARLHRLDRVFDGAECGHHDDRHVRVLPPNDLQHLESAHAGQLEIGKDEIRAVDQWQRFFRRARPFRRQNRRRATAVRGCGAACLRLPLPEFVFSWIATL